MSDSLTLTVPADPRYRVLAPEVATGLLTTEDVDPFHALNLCRLSSLDRRCGSYGLICDVNLEKLRHPGLFERRFLTAVVRRTFGDADDCTEQRLGSIKVRSLGSKRCRRRN
jgi:hypothetical protein